MAALVILYICFFASYFVGSSDWLTARLGGNTFTDPMLPRAGGKVSIVLNERSTGKSGSFWRHATGMSIIPKPLVTNLGIGKQWWKTAEVRGGSEHNVVERYHVEYFDPMTGKTTKGPSETKVEEPPRSVEFTIAEDPDNALPSQGQNVVFQCKAPAYEQEVTFRLFPASVDPNRVSNIEGMLTLALMGVCASAIGIVTYFLEKESKRRGTY